MKLLNVILAAALAAGALCAQTYERITVKFPSPVVVNGVTLPAGNATIQVIHSNASSILAVRSESGVYAGVLASRVEEPEGNGEPKVLFDEKAGVFYLSKVVLPDNIAYQIFDGQ